jgi:branched-chain amino acid transport system substrate-binding protein
MRPILKGVVLATAVALAAVGCGSSSSSGGGSGNSTTPPSGGSTAGASFSRPLRIGVLFEVAGESSVAISDFANSAELAIKNINAAGGVGGQQIVFKRLPVSTLDAQQAATQYLKMVDWKPDVIVGFPGSTIEAVVPEITRAQIPVLTPTEDATLREGASNGSPYLWGLTPDVNAIPGSAADYFVKTLKAAKIGEISTNESYGNDSSAAFNAEMAKLGQKVTTNQKISPTASDLTSQVLALKGVDAIAAWIYPNEIGVLEKQLAQNGINVPVVGSGSAEIAINYGLVKPNPNVYGVLACTPNAAAPTSPLGKFVTQYKAAYKTLAFTQAIQVYDGVYVAAKAAELAGSPVASKIAAQIPNVSYTGICGGVYHSDGAHIMTHSLNITQFAPGGDVIKQTYAVPQIAGQ